MKPFVRGPWAKGITASLGGCLLFIAIGAPASAGDAPVWTQRQVTVGVLESFPPYYQLDDDGNPSGFAIAVMNEVAKRAGFEVTYHVAETAGAMFEDLIEGDVDIIPSLGISDYRKQYVAFTHPVDTFRIVLFVRNDTDGVTGIDDLKGRPVAVVVDNIGYRHLEKRTDIQLTVFPKFTDALFALLSAEVDAFAYPEPVTWKLAREARVSDRIKVADKPLFEIKRAMAVRKDNTALLTVLNQAVREFTSSPDYRKVYVAWFGKPDPIWTATRVARVMGGLMAVFILSMVWWRYRVGVQKIQELHRSEQRLRESENLFNSIIENVPVGLLLKDSNHVVERANSTYLNWYGFDADTMVGRRSNEIEDFQSTDEVEIMNAQEQEVLNTGQTQTRLVERPFADDRVHTVSITKFPVYDQQGDITKVGSVSIDLTERIQAQNVANAALREAETANRAKSEFLAAMSHDFRTPLNAILGFAEILMRQDLGPIGDKYREYAADIRSSGEHLLTLVNQILDLAAIEAGKHSMNKETLYIGKLVGDCERIVAERARSKGIDLVTDVPKDLPLLYADKRASMQILLNLLSNAIKFTPKGGKITVSATASERTMTLTVADTGRGIPAEKLPNLIEPFKRANTDPFLTEEGWGLGLIIAKSLVDLHDGKLEIKSTVGKGTTVTVTVPNEAR